jgi:integrase
VRVDLPGVHRVKMKKRDGSLVFYYYAWRGGPRLTGEPGSPEFIDSYQATRANRRHPKSDVFHSVIVAYRAAPDGFRKLSKRTQADYVKILTKIEIAFGDLPLAALKELRVTKHFLDWRSKLSAASPRQADYAWAVLMRLISFARGRGMTAYRLPEQVERLYQSDRSDKIWTEANIAQFMGVASEPLQLAMVLALETGQREGDLLVLPWSAYTTDDVGRQWIVLRQSKSRRHNRPGRRVDVPVTKRLRAVLENTQRISPLILTNLKGRPWTGDGFRSSWRKACAKAGIVGVTFHDLRGTAVTRLSAAGCTLQEIVAITGHSLRDAANILDKYSARTNEIAIAAIAKLERGRK